MTGRSSRWVGSAAERARDPGPRALALVVDDDELLRACLARILRRTGIEVVTAAHGAEALALLARAGLRPDVVFTDLNMPVLDGAGLVEGLRAIPALADVPVVVVSASGERCQGATLHVAKPFDVDDILDALERVGAGPHAARARLGGLTRG